MDFELVTGPEAVPPPAPDDGLLATATPLQRNGLLIRSDPARSSLEDCVSMIDEMRFAIDNAQRIDAGLVRELRVWEERRLELEDRVSRENAEIFFPPGMEPDEIVEHLERLLELAKQLGK